MIAALITVDTPPDNIYKAWRKKRFELITSEWQLEEFRRVSRYPKSRNYINPSEAGHMVNGLRRRATILESLPMVDFCNDPDDNPVLAMALESKADFLVTGDKRDLLSMERIGETPIISAAAFLLVLLVLYSFQIITPSEQAQQILEVLQQAVADALKKRAIAFIWRDGRFAHLMPDCSSIDQSNSKKIRISKNETVK